jgi:hypothetical protein
MIQCDSKNNTRKPSKATQLDQEEDTLSVTDYVSERKREQSVVTAVP